MHFRSGQRQIYLPVTEQKVTEGVDLIAYNFRNGPGYAHGDIAGNERHRNIGSRHQLGLLACFDIGTG